jgi:hypothetical protein
MPFVLVLELCRNKLRRIPLIPLDIIEHVKLSRNRIKFLPDIVTKKYEIFLIGGNKVKDFSRWFIDVGANKYLQKINI